MTDAELATAFVVSIASFGLWLTVGWSSISQPLRDWVFAGRTAFPKNVVTFSTVRFQRLRHFVVALLECPTCLGFWTGVAIGAHAYGTAKLALASGLTISASNTILAALCYRHLHHEDNDKDDDGTQGTRTRGAGDTDVGNSANFDGE